jgi:hypothetical protein
MLLSRHQNAGQNHDKKITNRSFEKVTKFKCLETTITNQNLIQEEIEMGLISGNAFYNSVQNLLSFGCCLKHKTWNIQIYNFAYCSVWL